MIKNRGLGLLAEVAADEDYYPVRRRGEKRRLNPNRAAIEWLENDTSDLLKAHFRYLMSDTGGRYGAAYDEPLDLILVTKAYGATLGTHHNRPMFECFGITGNKGSQDYADPCPDCDNLAYSPRECERHAGRREDDEMLARSAHRVVSNYVSELDRITGRQTALYARLAGVDGSEINLSWRVNPS